jgi:hypothetical protein
MMRGCRQLGAALRCQLHWPSFREHAMTHPLPSQALEHIPDHVLDKHPEFADVLAVAFTDQNGNHTYEPGTDTLIASLLDINNDHVVSVGDRIHWGTYPTTFDVNGPRGTFTGPDELVTNVGGANSLAVEVETAFGTVFWGLFFGDEFITGNPFIQFRLQENNIFQVDHIFANPNGQGPGHPDTPVAISSGQAGNQGFFDVQILI